MLYEPVGVLEAVITALNLEDLDSAAAYFDDNAEIIVFTPATIVLNGREALRRRLDRVVGEFSVQLFEARTILPHDDAWRTQIHFRFQHRASGQILDGVMRVIACVRDGRIVRWHEYQDSERVDAFMRLVNAR